MDGLKSDEVHLEGKPDTGRGTFLSPLSTVIIMANKLACIIYNM